MVVVAVVMVQKIKVEVVTLMVEGMMTAAAVVVVPWYHSGWDNDGGAVRVTAAVILQGIMRGGGCSAVGNGSGGNDDG